MFFKYNYHNGGNGLYNRTIVVAERVGLLVTVYKLQAESDTLTKFFTSIRPFLRQNKALLLADINLKKVIIRDSHQYYLTAVFLKFCSGLPILPVTVLQNVKGEIVVKKLLLQSNFLIGLKCVKLSWSRRVKEVLERFWF